jgi:hypothetical protein
VDVLGNGMHIDLRQPCLATLAQLPDHRALEGAKWPDLPSQCPAQIGELPKIILATFFAEAKLSSCTQWKGRFATGSRP